MGHSYTHLTLEDRCQMAYLPTTGHSIRQIAATLDRAPSSIARELKRNTARPQGYQPGYADHQARARRWAGSKLDRNPPRRATVLTRLQHGWSPQQVAGRLAVEQHRPGISHETIYRFIYAQIARKQEYAWRHYLPQAKAKRGRCSYKRRSPASFIAQRVERRDFAAGQRTREPVAKRGAQPESSGAYAGPVIAGPATRGHLWGAHRRDRGSEVHEPLAVDGGSGIDAVLVGGGEEPRDQFPVGELVAEEVLHQREPAAHHGRGERSAANPAYGKNQSGGGVLSPKKAPVTLTPGAAMHHWSAMPHRLEKPAMTPL